ncbi:sulfotransferase family protein [Nannocystaceae bacterium ST9]
MKVIGAGFGRTGTTSMKAALERLGMPCYHMIEVFGHLDHVPVWRDAQAGRPVDWQALFADFQATVDWPGCTFYRQLMEVYPDAKVVLTVREPEKWYRSTFDTIFTIAQVLPSWLRYRVPRIGRLHRMLEEIIWRGTFHDRFADEAHALAIYRAHVAEVEIHVPPERLLVFDVKDGWAPLCAFLGVPAPDEPFPHLNDTAEFQRNIRRLRGVWIGVRVFVLVVIAAMIGWLGWLIGR